MRYAKIFSLKEASRREKVDRPTSRTKAGPDGPNQRNCMVKEESGLYGGGARRIAGCHSPSLTASILCARSLVGR